MTALRGQQEQMRGFAEAVLSGRMPPVWLLAGPRGIGKASFAMQAARFLLSDGDQRPLNPADPLAAPPSHSGMALIEAGSHPEFLILERLEQESSGRAAEVKLARNITIEQVRMMLARLRNRPAVSRWRVIIIDAIDDCERGAANALLKCLEEPPENTVFLLVSHAPARLLPTIISRCRKLRFEPLPNADVEAIVRQALPELASPQITAICSIAHGSPGRAMRLATGGVAETAALLSSIAASGDPANILRSQLAKELAPAAARVRYEAMLEQARQLAADHALAAPSTTRAQKLAVYEKVTDIAKYAVGSSEDVATVCFSIGTAIAELHTGNAAG